MGSDAQIIPPEAEKLFTITVLFGPLVGRSEFESESFLPYRITFISRLNVLTLSKWRQRDKRFAIKLPAYLFSTRQVIADGDIVK